MVVIVVVSHVYLLSLYISLYSLTIYITLVTIELKGGRGASL